MKITPEIMACCTPYGNGVYGYRRRPNARPVKYWYREACQGCGEPYLATHRYTKGEESKSEYCSTLCARKNLPMTEERRATLSRARTGIPHTAEARERIKQAQLGHRMPDHVNVMLRSPEINEKRAATCKREHTAVKRAAKVVKPDAASAKNRLFSSYLDGATKRGLPFSLSKEDFLALVEQDCHYCGVSPQRIIVGKSIHFTVESSYTCNGIDRIDSAKGYQKGNVVPCCADCNCGKKQHSVDTFLSWACRVASFNPGGNRVLIQIPPTPFTDTPPVTSLYNKYRSMAKQRGHVFALNKQVFDKLIRTQCHYCGAPPSAVKRLSWQKERFILYTGLDRKNSDLGYTRRNVVPCCKMCNYAKRVLSVTAFYAWVNRIVAHQDSLSAAKSVSAASI